MDSKDIARTMLDLGGQPGTVDISSDKNYIAIAIEDERGLIPHLPVVFLPSMSRSTPTTFLL
jgi:hypothetical protein